MEKYIYDIDITGKTEIDKVAGNNMDWQNVDSRDTKREAIKSAKNELQDEVVKGVRVVRCWAGDDENEPIDLATDVFIKFKI